MAETAITPSIPLVTRKEAQALGLARYFTGKPCSKGHIEERNTCDHACCACGRGKQAARRAADPSIAKRAIAARKLKYKEDPDFRKKRIKETAEWVARNKEKSKRYFAERYKNNKEEMLAADKLRREERKKDPAWVEKEKIRNKARHEANPEAKRCHVRTRRARIKKAEGTHNHKDIALILRQQGHKCAYCKSSLKGGYDVDHITPLAKGGSNWPSNLQCLCPPCNSKKSAKDPISFAQELGMLL